jgi:hypothetical protein
MLIFIKINLLEYLNAVYNLEYFKVKNNLFISLQMAEHRG